MEEAASAQELEDGTYSCDATNSTRGYGPYSLECEKSGETFVLHFENGGFITLDIDSQATTDGATWDIEATNAENGDSWELSISK